MLNSLLGVQVRMKGEAVEGETNGYIYIKLYSSLSLALSDTFVNKLHIIKGCVKGI